MNYNVCSPAVRAALVLLCACAPLSQPAAQALEAAKADRGRSRDDSLIGKSIAELQRDLDSGKLTSESLVRSYLGRIETLDRRGPALHAVLAVNPDVVEQARALDRERQQKKLRGPLHGIPILLKDNIESTDRLPTTAGSLALKGNMTLRDAPIVANLRAAGAIVLGKTNLSEWANFRSERSLSGWSAMGGLTKNAHVLDRSACGSSSGSAAATAAGFAVASIGTETDGSIVCPAAMNGVVGLKPTVGLLSQQYIVPISHSQDAPGPMTASVKDAALLLSGMVGDRPTCDPTISGCRKVDYAASLTTTALQGKRIGVLRFPTGEYGRIEPVYEKALDQLRYAGAVLVEVKAPSTGRINEAEFLVLNVEFKADLNTYLANAAAAVTTRSLAALIEFNKHNSRELALFGQDVFVAAEGAKGLDDAVYKTALADSQRLAREALNGMLSTQHLDLLVAPTTGAAWRIDTINADHFSGSFSTLPAVAGYPHLTVPMGEIDHLPVGISFIGPAWSEDVLLAAGFAFEQRAKARVTPHFLPSIDQGAALAPYQVH